MHIKNILILFTILGGLFMGNSLYAKPPVFLHNYKEAVEICKDLKQPMILIFSAEWCGPCKKLKQDITKYSDKFKDTTIVILDITKNAKLAKEYQVKSIPKSIFFDKEGNKTKEIMGYSNIEKFR